MIEDRNGRQIGLNDRVVVVYSTNPSAVGKSGRITKIHGIVLVELDDRKGRDTLPCMAEWLVRENLVEMIALLDDGPPWQESAAPIGPRLR